MVRAVNSTPGGQQRHARRSSRDRASQAERAYETLRDHILTLRLAPGAPLQEDELTAELAIGRTPLREAVKRLQFDSLVAIYPRRGTFVTEVNITDHALIADIRHQLEGHAARRAAERATDSERSELDDLRTWTENDPETDQYTVMDIDARVHRAIYRCTHNHYLESTLGHYYNLALRIWYLFFDQLPDMTEHVGEHSALLKAIVAGDADRADLNAVAHVDHFEQSIRYVL